MLGLEKLGYKIEIPPPEIDADLAVPCFKEDPQKIARQIMAIAKPYIEGVEVKGHYVNIKLDVGKLAPVVLKEILKKKTRYGFSNYGHRKSIFIEFSSPNIAKPLHIGHLRNTAIGHSLTRLYQFQGHKVITANYIGDWPPQNTQAGLKDAKRVYKLLGVDFDIWHGENFYEKLVPQAVKEALQKAVARKEPRGPVVVDLNPYALRSYLLVKSDGVSLYSARDLAAAQWRLKKYKPELLLYVVGHEQELYLKQIFKTLELLGYPAGKFKHISYGIITLAGRKMSTRRGHAQYAEAVINEAIKKAKGVKEVGIAAVIHKMLSQGREKDIDFNWEKALSLKGDSGPYIQYGFVRSQSILKKSKINPPAGGQKSIRRLADKTQNLNISEKNLIKLLAFYPYTVAQAQKLNAPQLLTTFLNNLTQEFNRFYETSPVLQAEAETKTFRLALTKAVGQVIKNGLWLLGISVPKRM